MIPWRVKRGEPHWGELSAELRGVLGSWEVLPVTGLRGPGGTSLCFPAWPCEYSHFYSFHILGFNLHSVAVDIWKIFRVRRHLSKVPLLSASSSQICITSLSLFVGIDHSSKVKKVRIKAVSTCWGPVVEHATCSGQMDPCEKSVTCC